MKLWVDGQCFQTASRNRGIGRYALELIKAIAKTAPDIELMVSLNAQMALEAIAARTVLEGIVAPHNIHVWHGAADAGEVAGGQTADRQLSELALVHHVNCLAPDVALSLSPFEGQNDPAVPLLPHKRLMPRSVGIFYDAIPIRFKKAYLDTAEKNTSYNRRLKACGAFDGLLCISEFSLTEARDLLGEINAINISAGVSSELAQLLDGSRQSSKLERPFILYVGGLDWRKNVGVVPDAIYLLPKPQRDQLDFVLAGDHPSDHLAQIVDRWTSLGLDRSAMYSLGHVSDSRLLELYHEASVVVQPSLMEGFGLTALESMMCGTPVVAARAGAVPEVIELDRLLFDPRSPADLAAKLMDVLGDPTIRSLVEEHGRRVMSKFTWENSGRLAAEFVRKLGPAPASGDVAVEAGGGDMRDRLAPDVASLPGDLQRKAEVLALAEPGKVEPRRLLVDATSTIQYQNRTGIQRVVRHICSAMVANARDDETRVLTTYCDESSGWYDVGGRLDEDARKDPDHHITVTRRDSLLMLDSSWNLHAVHRPFLTEARLRGAEVITCLYDLVPLYSPAFCDAGMPPIFRAWFLNALELSTGFVCISKAVADELLRLLAAIEYPHRMKVGYWRLGADFIAAENKAASGAATAKERPMMLMVGTLEPRKGHSVALDAFEQVWASGLDVELVIVGKQGWNTEVLARRIRAHPEHGRRLTWHATADDALLGQLYATCDGLIAASYTEGFGLPIVEAGHFGKPVLASDIPVFREVAAGAPYASFFAVGSPSSLAAKLESFVVLLPTLRNTEAAHAAWPNWSESARELEHVVLDEAWYRVYEPQSPEQFVSVEDIGHVRAHAAIDGTSQDASLRLIDARMSDQDGDFRITLAVTNESKIPWFGVDDDEGDFGVGVRYHVLDRRGGSLRNRSVSTFIPLVVAPGDTQYLSVSVPASAIKRDAAAVALSVFQKGTDWSSLSLQVPLPNSEAARQHEGAQH